MSNRHGLGSFLFLALVAACGSDSSDDSGAADAAGSGPTVDAAGQNNPDASQTPDAAIIVLPDARPSALACAGDPLPTTVAAPPIVISGTVQEASAAGGLSTLNQSAHVAALQVADDALIVEGDFTGAFTLTGPDTSDPIDAYLKATSSGFVDTYVFPPAIITASLDSTPIIMVSPLIFGTLLPAVAAAAQESGNGAVIVAAVDCDQAPVEGATLTITPNAGTLHYSSATGLPGQMGDFAATQSPGITYFLNLPPGNYAIDATAEDGTTLRTVNVKVFADSSSTAVIAP